MGVGIYLAINALMTFLALLASKRLKCRFNRNLILVVNILGYLAFRSSLFRTYIKFRFQCQQVNRLL